MIRGFRPARVSAVADQARCIFNHFIEIFTNHNKRRSAYPFAKPHTQWPRLSPVPMCLIVSVKLSFVTLGATNTIQWMYIIHTIMFDILERKTQPLHFLSYVPQHQVRPHSRGRSHFLRRIFAFAPGESVYPSFPRSVVRMCLIRY